MRTEAAGFAAVLPDYLGLGEGPGVHPWMHAYAVVHDHPFFAVTGTDGVFSITGVPQGTYTLEAWHPTLGAKSMQVKIGVGAKGAITARFSYKPN